MSSVETCEYCGFEVAPFLDRCPHCARPSRFPNVIQANSAEEQQALERRYEAARNEARARGVETILSQFEEAVAQQSRAVIARPLEEVSRLANSDRELYAGFYDLVRAGTRIPSDDQWDRYRGRMDEALFPHYKDYIRFAALCLDDKGLINYGECSLVLRNDMIEHRATVFEENSWGRSMATFHLATLPVSYLKMVPARVTTSLLKFTFMVQYPFVLWKR